MVKRRSRRARRFDMISNLPDSIIDTILMKLPTIDAARTSVLSRTWRYNWMRLVQFTFDADMWKSVVVKDSTRSMVTMMLLRLILEHEGPVFKFTLSIPDFESSKVIDNFIFFLSWNNIEDFTFEMWKDRYAVPASIFECQQLRHLKLVRCCVSNPWAVEGFSRLTTLKLIDIEISEEALRILISESPLLEILELGVSNSIDIYIDAPNLRKFSCKGSAKSMNLQLMPLLASVSIALDAIVKDHLEICSSTQFFQSLPVIEYLHLNFCMIEKFTIEEPDLFTTLVHLHLRYLHLCLLHFSRTTFQFTLYLLRSSPNLKTVKVEIQNLNADDWPNDVRGEDYSDIWLSQLEDVQLYGVDGSEIELEFIKLLLAKSPSLKRIQIALGSIVGTGHTRIKEAIKLGVSKEIQVIYRE